ncbi:hypothetical protein [Bifidobacterium eulemuris]|uniref:Uncharacterized protein n=1 Tax=Bifidobacterium eulemuris TaxID=1765219 RepID=A0A261GA16_9BIFI|nr:hypothetical protein [Bifidobacterium eulemuris]OZG68260.1 hypothetical protein BEUL_1273 [Bifidobacterium eulemuris]QOL31685.1 hypothetical protein BE0216_03830 [Bifidobacterium eulemuris]
MSASELDDDGCEAVAPEVVQAMVERVDSRLMPVSRFGGFEPCEWVYRIGGFFGGYVTEAEWDGAFAGEPEWAEATYLSETGAFGTEADDRGYA